MHALLKMKSALTNDWTFSGVITVAVTSPSWKPIVHSVSEFSSETLPILGWVAAALLIINRLQAMFRNGDDK
jgi:hypothetical protein